MINLHNQRTYILFKTLNYTHIKKKCSKTSAFNGYYLEGYLSNSKCIQTTNLGSGVTISRFLRLTKNLILTLFVHYSKLE